MAERSHLALVLLALGSACGGIAVIDGAGGAGAAGAGGGGAGGGDPQFECVLECGGVCIKCQGNDCFSGWCSSDGKCLPPDVPVSCPEK